MNQFLCSQTAAGFKIFVKLCAPLKKPDMGWRRATGGDGGRRGKDKVSGWACTRCGVFAGRSDFAQQSQRLAAAQRVFRLPTRNLLNYLWQLSCNFILLPSTEPTFHRPRMLGTQRPPSAPCLLNSSPFLPWVCIELARRRCRCFFVRNFDFSFLCSSVISRSCAASHDQRSEPTVPPSPPPTLHIKCPFGAPFILLSPNAIVKRKMYVCFCPWYQAPLFVKFHSFVFLFSALFCSFLWHTHFITYIFAYILI